jgi:4-alpha-glucanotransferase
VDGRLIGEATFAVPPDLPLGYHTLRARSGGREAACPLIVTPAWVGLPRAMGSDRTWGVALQLYSVRSRRSWGVGDFNDLAELGAWAVERHRAGFILVNPLHAAELSVPMEPSPYLPSSRRFVNPLYLRVEDIREYAYLEDTERNRIRELHRQVAHLNTSALIDRDAAWTAKDAALRILHRAPRPPGRQIAYEAFLAREGDGLQDFATWNALATEYGLDWRHWPARYHSPDAAAVDAFREEHRDEVDYLCWLQWIIDGQLSDLQGRAKRVGMPVWLMQDLAVGVNPRGADAWSLQAVIAQGVSVGAPPDASNQLGQDWSQPPWCPLRLAASGYTAYRDLLRSVLRHAGGLRVDHIIGLFRLWWIPEGAAPTAGTYVRYDHEALVGILALEAVRANALLVGEDLGTVEPWVRDYLRERGVLGTSVLWFEYDQEGKPLAPEHWRELCLATVTTHDLPPTAGYLAGDHVRLRHQLGLLTRDLQEELAVDSHEREAWLNLLRQRGLLAAGDGPDAVTEALHTLLMASPAHLIGVSLPDMVGDRSIQNQPGTDSEYPNWRMPLCQADGSPLLLEDLIAMGRAITLPALVGGR